MSAPEHYDLAVIGGGIAGLYCCLHAPPGMRLALFEASGRIGGKLETVEMDGFQAEYGSMRFDPDKQHLMRELIRELRLETEPFPEYTSPPVTESQIPYGLAKDEKGLNALELFALGIRRVLRKSESELMSLSEEELEYLRRNGMHGDQPLWQLGLWDVLADVLSYGAVKYIMTDGTFFHGIHENPGVVGTMITWVKMLQMSEHLKGVKGGMQLITDRMLQRVKDKGVAVHTGHSLQALSTRGKQVTLVFDTGRFTARHVILALPSAPLEAVKGIPENIRPLLDSVIEYPLLKCFFVVREPWWDVDVPQKGALAFPTRELHYYRQGGKGMIMVYADRPSINFWRKYVEAKYHDRAELNNSKELPVAFAKRMNIGAGTVLSYGIRDWTREPYGAGVHLWRAGVEPWKVSEKLEAFSLNENSPQNVHICGEAFYIFRDLWKGPCARLKACWRKR